MSYRAIFVADVHMSNALPYSMPTENGKTDRLEDQLRLWEHIRNTADEYEVDDVWLLGDLYDKSRVDPVTLAETAKSLKGFKTVYLLPGNHDAASLKGERFAVEAFGVLNNSCQVIGMDNSKHGYPAPTLIRPKLCFWPLAYMPVAETRSILEKIRGKLDTKITNVLLFHNSVIGAKHLGWVCDDGIDPDELVDGFDWVLSGHFHDHQQFGPEDEGMYLGAPMQHHYGDAGRSAGYWLIEFKDNGERIDKFIDPGLPQFHVYTNLDTKAMKAKRGDYVRIEVNATHSDWVSLKKKAEETCQRLTADGVRASFHHKPIYHHKTRLKKTEGKAKLSLEDSVDQYVDATDVVKGSLDQKVLKRVGREILVQARGGHGPV